MDYMSHEDYRNTEYWYNLRHKLFDMRGGRCEKCNKRLYGEEFDIHHMDGIYRMFDEDLDNLMILCRECHSTYHKTDYMIPEGSHDFTVEDVTFQRDKNTEPGYSIKLAVVRKYDSKTCYCWYWAQKGSKYEHLFRKSVGLSDDTDLMYAIGLKGRALFIRDGDFNRVERFFTKIITDYDIPF